MSEHLDDVALSAILDGEDPPSSHLDECASCRARAHELHTAARLVGGTVSPPDPAQREAAVTAALRTRQPAGRWRPSGPAVAIAALVLVIAALVPLLALRGGDSDDSSRLADHAADSREAAGNTPTANALLAPNTVQAGDLGTIDGDLRERVEGALRSARPTEGPLSDTPFACDSDVRAMDKKAGNLVLFGTATVNNQLGYVLVYAIVGSDPPRVAAYVVAQNSCSSILQFASFVRRDGDAGTSGTR